MSLFAATTSVPIERTVADLQRLLRRYGAGRIGQIWEGDGCAAQIAFEMNNRRCRFTVTTPDIKDFKYTPSGRYRDNDQQKKAWEQAKRQRWRALLLLIQAKLEAIESGEATFDNEFLAYTLLPSGQTVGEWSKTQLQIAYEGNQMPRLMIEE